MNTRTLTTPTRYARGFTLVEMLIAVFILGIGLSAVVSVFYAAASLQQRAFDEVTTKQVKSNAKAMIMARGFDEATVTGNANGSWNIDAQVHRLTNESSSDMLQKGPSPELRWPLALRAHPLVAEPAGSDPNVVDHDFYWVPLVRDADTGPNPGEQDWRMYIFVLRKTRDDMRPDATAFNYGKDHVANPDDEGTDTDGDMHYVPWVYGLDASYDGPSSLTMTESPGDYLRVGDQVLVGTGTPATVIGKDGDTITLNAPHGLPSGGVTRVWFSPPPLPDAASPTHFILTLGNGAVKP